MRTKYLFKRTISRCADKFFFLFYTPLCWRKLEQQDRRTRTVTRSHWHNSNRKSALTSWRQPLRVDSPKASQRSMITYAIPFHTDQAKTHRKLDFDLIFHMTPHYELPMEKKVPWNGAVSMRSRAGSWETLSICITLRHNQGAPADMHANALGILIICRFPLA